MFILLHLLIAAVSVLGLAVIGTFIFFMLLKDSAKIQAALGLAGGLESAFFSRTRFRFLARFLEKSDARRFSSRLDLGIAPPC